MPTTVTGGAAVIDALVAHGVRDVFGIPGTHNLELYRYLPASGIRHVVVRHEQGAGYAADGYARASGRPGVLITTSGPGITNAITALGTAYADSIPVLAIAPGPPRGDQGKDLGGLHEMKDQLGALLTVCGTAIRVEHADEIGDVVASIFEQFATTRPRPAYLEIPLDVLDGEWTRTRQTCRAIAEPSRPDLTTIHDIAAALERSQRPLLIAGGGAKNAAAPVRTLADLGIKILTTVNGKGVLDESHPSALGASLRLPAAQSLANDADLLLIVGSELGDSDLWGGTIEPGSPERTIVRIDLDAAQLHKNVVADVPVLGDAGTALEALVEILGEQGFATRAVNPADRASIDASAESDGRPWAELQRSLHRALPQDTIIAADNSRVTYFGAVHFWPISPAGRFLYPTGFSTLGYGLPAAIGAKIASPDRPVVALLGDGAAMFSIQELITATEQHLPIAIIIADNGGYGEIRDHMIERGIQTQGVELLVPDVPALAEAMGAIGLAAKTADEVAQFAAEALSADRPTVIYFAVDDSAA